MSVTLRRMNRILCGDHHVLEDYAVLFHFSQEAGYLAVGVLGILNGKT